MPALHTERAFESAIERHLVEVGGYEKGNPDNFNRARALDESVLIPFIQSTQEKTWNALAGFHGAKTSEYLLDDLGRALASEGMLAVLRHGFKCYGKLVRVAHFAPANRMNPETQALYAANKLTVTRQVHFSERDEQSLDMVLSLNGLPIATVELKNQFTGQSVWDSMRQYRDDRDPRELLFQFKARALVHFAVDTNLAYMTTKLEGKDTQFLPFNRGHRHGAGNPPNPQGVATSYVWEEMWQRDSLLDLVGRFLHLQVEEKEVPVMRGGVTTLKRIRKETMIFPRFHQVDAVRKLCGAARAQGAGRHYLVQHSAGSGKSNTIAWLAHRLASLHDEADRKIFDSVIVITDRLVLDKQLQDPIYQFEHKQGVVQKIDDDSTQLAEALRNQTPIIITTLQKFPFVTEKAGSLPDRRYAVIVDEAHSSQSGETATELKGVLADAGLRAKAKEMAADEGIDDSADEAMLLTMLKRGRQPNLSFFAFTATPKHKTLKIFDEPGPSGEAPFHLYSMRQAIEEKFILDVLKNYVSYNTYFKLTQSAADDPLVTKKDAARALARFVAHHPHNVASRVEVMVEHFRTHTRHKIGGRAKAMVVTDSRLAAVRYKLAFDKYLAEKKYHDIKTLVAFSGQVTDEDIPDKTFTEAGMNGFSERKLPEAFAGEEYQILLVAEKYQTGFDQPLLHTMYVDKRLDGVQAVQTLSRLNRTASGKEDTFVLDFRNDPADILAAFKPYYEYTDAAESVPAQKLYELKGKLDAAQVYFLVDVNDFCKIFFGARNIEAMMAHAGLNRIVDVAVERYVALDEDAQDKFFGLAVSFRRLYAFLSQVIPYQDSDLEKLYTYLRFLLAKLPRDDPDDRFTLGDEVDLKYYRLQKISEGSIDLRAGEPEPLAGPGEVGTRRAKDEPVRLSSLVEKLNERFGTAFTPADQLFFDAVRAEAIARDDFERAVKVNTVDDFRLVLEREVDGLFIDRMEGNDQVFRKVMEDEKVRTIAVDWLLDEVYRHFRSN